MEEPEAGDLLLRKRGCHLAAPGGRAPEGLALLFQDFDQPPAIAMSRSLAVICTQAGNEVGIEDEMTGAAAHHPGQGQRDQILGDLRLEVEAEVLSADR